MVDHIPRRHLSLTITPELEDMYGTN